MFESLTKFKDVKFNAPEESDDQSTQYGVNPGRYNCHRECEKSWGGLARAICKQDCNYYYKEFGAPEHTPQESASTVISNTLQNIGANFWLGVLNDLKERGVEDILIACN